MTVSVRFKMHENAEDLVPSKAHDGDAAYDLCSRTTTSIAARQSQLVPTGLFLELPEGYEAQVRPRSGLALKHGITVLNAPGTVDSGYRGEVGVILFNSSENAFEIARGDRIAQMVIQSLPEVTLVNADNLAASGRSDGGFGSTGVQNHGAIVQS